MHRVASLRRAVPQPCSVLSQPPVAALGFLHACRSNSQGAVDEHGMQIVTAEAAHLAARRNIGVVVLPTFLDDPVVARSKELQLRPKMVAQISRNLESAKRKLTLSKSRGGLQPEPKFLENGRLQLTSDSIAADTASQLERAGLLGHSAKDALALLGRRTKPDSQLRAAAQLLVPAYDAKQVVAHSATQLPGAYACLVRILDELRFRQPSFHPRTVLDYNSGPGTGVWATHEVWPGRVDHVTAVEPSGAMVDMGLRIQQALQEHNPAKRMPNIRWLGRLPKAPRGGATGPPDKRRYDLTVAVHALTHVVDRSERMRIVRDLWTRSNGILVIMEPGTPVGSSAVREARSQLLREENKRQVQFETAQKQLAAALQQLEAGPVGDQGSDVSSSSDRHAALQQWRDRAAALSAKLGVLGDDATGVHVLAPCAHDGACPMEYSGTRSWCHFRQRVRRTHLHRMCKIRKNAVNGPRGWQYARYSYVVLKRGPRPPRAFDVFISPIFREFDADTALLDANVPPRLVDAIRTGATVDPLDLFPFLTPENVRREEAADLRAARTELRAVQAELSGGSIRARSPAAGDASADISEPNAGSRHADELPGDKDGGAHSTRGGRVRGAVHTRTDAATDSWGEEQVEEEDSEGEGGAGVYEGHAAARAHEQEARQFLHEYLAAIADLQQHPDAITSLRHRVGDPAVTGRDGEMLGQVEGEVPVAAQRQDGTPGFEGNSQLHAHGSPETTGEDAARLLTPRAAPAAAPAASSPPQPFMHVGRRTDTADAREADAELRAHGRTDLQPHVAPAQSADVDQEQELWMRGRDWSKEDPSGVDATRVASSSWSRLIRKPIKNGRHVILDVCVATPDQKSGQLERHIVAHSDRKRPWMGPAAYRLARRLKWGDLWPSIYHRNHRVQSCK